jgi:hypothetical protein
MNTCSIAYPFSPHIASKFKFIILQLFFVSSSTWSPNQLSAFSKSFKHVFLGIRYSNELYYKLFKSLSVEIHPFLKIYKDHYYKVKEIHSLALQFFLLSDKAIFDDFLIFVYLFENKNTNDSALYQNEILRAMFGKGKLEPLKPNTLLEVILSRSNPSLRSMKNLFGQLMVLKKGLFQDTDANLENQISTTVSKIELMILETESPIPKEQH